MQRSLSQMLLMDSDLYLAAVQHKSVQINSLGLHEVRYPFNSVRNTTGKKVLKAVIPTDGQREFLMKSGLIESTFPSIPEGEPASKELTPHQQRKERSARRRKKEEDEKRHKSSKKQTEDDPHVVKHAARRTSIGGTPLFTKPSQAHLHILEREREDAIWRTKQKERFVKLGESFDIVDKDGVKYVYDYRGFKVPEEEYERQQQAAMEKDLRRKSTERKIELHNCALIEKTRRFVDDMRRKVVEDMILDYRWYPGKFPSTTVPPRCHSAGSTRRSFINDLRDINSLGKSLQSPFQSGVTPVLPVDLVHKWPEYRVMEEGDVVLTIEHCCNCFEHCEYTHHKEEHYKQLADEVKDALSATAMKFAVRFYAVHKPVRFQDPLHKSLSHSEKLINKDSDDHRPPEKKAFNVDYTTRLGAFEVQVAIKTRKDFICHLLFSKLFRGVWPKVSSLQKLLERLLSEARFNRLDSDGPSENSSPKSRKFGMRRQSTKVTLLPKTAMEEDEVSELHAEFDLRDKEPPQLEQPPFTLQVSFMEQSPWSDTGREGNNSTSVCEDGIAADTDAPTGFSSTTPAISSGPDAAIAAATELSAAPASDSARLDAGADAVSEDEVEAAYQRYQELLRVAQLQRGEASSSSAAQESPSGKDRILTRVGSAKAAIRALGYASVGLQLIRSKTQSAKDPVHAGLISPERAMEIANETHSNRVPGASEADDDPNAHFTKKGSSIGVLSRQNAGGGKGRFLHVDDEDAAAEEAAFGPPGQMLPASPPPGAMLTRGSSMASGAPSNSSFERSNSTVSISAVSSAKAPYNRGSSTVSVTPFSDTSSKLQKLNLAVDDVGEDEDQIGFSPTNSSKSSVPTTAAALTTKGSSLVRHRSASISALAVAPTEIAKMKMSRNKAQSEKSLGGVRQGSPKNGQHRPHPSLEMRKKLDIGMLSRQTAAKGGKLVVPDDDSDGDGDGAGSDLSDSAPPTPLKKFTNAMKEAVDAVNAATEVSNDQKATLTAEDTKVAHTTAANHPPHVTVAAIPPYAAHRAVVHPEEATETVAPDATSRNNPRTSEGTTHTAHASANNTDQVQVKEAVLPHSALPSLVASEEVHHHQHQHQQPEIPVPNLEVSATSPAESDTAAPAAAPVVAEATQVSPPSDVPVAPKLSAAEILQTRRHMTEQLLSDVSKDILKRANSSQEDGGYGDDFEDLEDSLSPTRGGNNNNNGFEDLFDAAEFQLSQISEGTQERG